MFKRKGGGSKAFWTMLKNCNFLKGWLPLDGRVLCRCHCLDSFCPASKVPVIRVPRSTRAGHRLRRRGCPTHYCSRKKLMINHSKHARAHNTRCAQVLAQLPSCFEGGSSFLACCSQYTWVGLRGNVLHFSELKFGDKIMLFVSGTFLFISAFFSLRWVAF